MTASSEKLFEAPRKYPVIIILRDVFNFWLTSQVIYEVELYCPVPGRVPLQNYFQVQNNKIREKSLGPRQSTRM